MDVIRQGDVLLVRVEKLPEGCKEIPHINGAIVLAFGEVTGHKHQVTDWQDSGRIARNAIHATKIRARLLEKDGARFLEVVKPVTLKHEEHSPAKIAPGIYELPAQVEHTADKIVRLVSD